MTSQIVVDASPLIILIKSNLDHLLPQLFDEVLIPDGAWEEILAGKESDAARQKLPNLAEVNRASISELDSRVEQYDLGRGESEALTLALTLSDSRVLIDDAAARTCAKSLGVSFIGTGGLLILARRKRLIPSFSDALADIQSAGMWIGENIVELLKKQAGDE